MRMAFPSYALSLFCIVSALDLFLEDQGGCEGAHGVGERLTDEARSTHDSEANRRHF
jgi:hypothetical protein